MKILECEGYKMFEGIVEISPKTDKVNPFTIEGVWLYKPDTKCWYCNGRSFTSDIITILEVF